MRSRRVFAKLLALIFTVYLLTGVGRPAFAAEPLQIGHWVYQDGHYETETYWVPDRYGYVDHWHPS